MFFLPRLPSRERVGVRVLLNLAQLVAAAEPSPCPLPEYRNDFHDHYKPTQTKQFASKLAFGFMQGGKSWKTNCSGHFTG